MQKLNNMKPLPSHTGTMVDPVTVVIYASKRIWKPWYYMGHVM